MAKFKIQGNFTFSGTLVSRMRLNLQTQLILITKYPTDFCTIRRHDFLTQYPPNHSDFNPKRHGFK